MPAKITRSRSVEYSDWQDVIEDVDRLVQLGYKRSGNWSLGQAASHLAQWTAFPIDGYPTPPWFMRLIFRILKWSGTVDKMKSRILTEGFQIGHATDPSTVPSQAISDQDGVEQLKDVFERARRHRRELHSSPLFGDMDLATYKRISLLHAAHHLSFFQPAMSNQPATGDE